MSWLIKAWVGVGCSLLLLLLSHSRYSLAAQLSEIPSSICPFTYEEHSLVDIRSGAKKPYLLGGIYNQTKLW
jgi:hypothetical protein